MIEVMKAKRAPRKREVQITGQRLPPFVPPHSN
jgi:hypothetical protein